MVTVIGLSNASGSRTNDLGTVQLPQNNFISTQGQNIPETPITPPQKSQITTSSSQSTPTNQSTNTQPEVEETVDNSFMDSLKSVMYSLLIALLVVLLISGLFIGILILISYLIGGNLLAPILKFVCKYETIFAILPVVLEIIGLALSFFLIGIPLVGLGIFIEILVTLCDFFKGAKLNLFLDLFGLIPVIGLVGNIFKIIRLFF